MKKQLDDKDYALIARYLGNELEENEKEVFDQWLANSDENRLELAKAEKIWAAGDVRDTKKFNTDQGWVKLHKRIHSKTKAPLLKSGNVFAPFLKIAASIVVLLGIGFIIYWFAIQSGTNEVIAEQKILKPVVLPDGTKVYLNQGATLIYPEEFAGEIRKVELSGEAFFEVARNEKQPFIIQTPQAEIKVLGTSFNVLANKKSDSVQVVVETGVVELSPRSHNQKITLTKGNTGSYYINSDKLNKSTISDINATAWKTDVIIFHDADLLYITKTLNRLFPKQVELKGEHLHNCRINSDFKQSNLESILKTIHELLGVDVTKTDKGYIISGPGC